MTAQKGVAAIPFIVAVGLIITAAGFLFAKNQTSLQRPILVAGTNHYLGNTQSRVVVEEFVDYQCEACADYDEISKEIIKKYGSQIIFYVRHYPIVAHKNALSAAEAAEAADAQGKFWEMHELLLQNQKQWAHDSSPQKIFYKYAKQLDLNTDQFQKNLENMSRRDAIIQDRRYGETMKIDAIPSIIINGKNEGYVKDSFKLSDAIDHALKQTAILPTGTQPQPISTASASNAARAGLSLKNTLRFLWWYVTEKSNTPKQPECVNVCKSGDCLCELADINITLHGEKPRENEDLMNALDQLRNLKYVPAKGGLSFIGRKVLDRAIDNVEAVIRETKKIGRKLSGVDVYATIAAFPCTKVACASTTKLVWGKELTQTIRISPPKDCQHAFVPDAWDEKCLTKNKEDFYPYINREAKKSCSAICQSK